jgi:hypothetical protein
MASKKSKAQMVAAVQQLSTATTKRLASGTQVQLLGSSLTPDQIANKLQSFVSARNAVNAARSSLRAAVAAEAAQAPDRRSFIAAYESFVRAAFGADIEALGDFGLIPKERSPLTAEKAIVAVANRASTRAARHTMGPKRKLAIKGDVIGVTVTTKHAAASAAVAPSSPTDSASSAGPTAAATRHTA